MRLAVYTDHAYTVEDGTPYGDRAYVAFLTQLREHTDALVLVGRLDPRGGKGPYPLPSGVELAGLPHYSGLNRPVEVARVLARSARRLWRVLDRVDTVWLHGPHPMALLFAALAAARGRAVRLAVRQDLPAYTRSRHPGKRSLALAADLLEAAWKLLARRYPVAVVGPDLAHGYRHAPRVLELSVSMVRERDLAGAPRPGAFSGDRLLLLTVGRIDEEKNPLLLADVLARLRVDDPRWRLVVCGEGPLEQALRERLGQLGLLDHVELRGYVPIDRLMELYRASDAFLHVSWTEGLPQVLWEAWAARVPVVATAVGGVPAAADGAALLVRPGDADAAAAAVRRLSADEGLRAALSEAGAGRVRTRTIEAEIERVARFLASPERGPERQPPGAAA